MITYTDPYSTLATAYDRILEHVDYQEWYSYIKAIMLKYCKNPRTVLELACGTGRFGAKFSADGYDIFGIDCSIDMLRVAKVRAFKNFRIFCSDMTSFTLARPADFIFCVHDSMNYLMSKKEMRKAFRCVYEAMHSESIYMFDVTTEFNIRNNFENVLNTYDIAGRSIEWNNSYNKRKRLVQSTLRFHSPDGTVDEEDHFQRIYSVDEVSAMLKKENFEILGIFSDYSFDAPCATTVMINFVARKKR